jgi:hypothetical protein
VQINADIETYRQAIGKASMNKVFQAKILLILAAAAGLVVVTMGQANAATSQDCTTNSVIKCGASSPSDLVAKIKANSTGDLPGIYNTMGLSPDRYTSFASQAKTGTAYYSSLELGPRIKVLQYGILSRQQNLI